MIRYFKSGSEEWKKAREEVLFTGTSLSSAFGLDSKIPETILEKYKEQIEAAKIWGRLLEPGILITLNELGIKAEPSAPWGEVAFITDNTKLLGCSLDGIIQEKTIPVECKTAVINKYSGWLKTPPINYIIQLYVEIMCLEAPYGLLACLRKGEDKPFKEQPQLVVYKLVPKEEVFELIYKTINRFKKNPNSRVSPKDKEAIKELCLNSVEKVYEI